MPEPSVDDLLDAWQSAYAAGRDLPPADLCRGRPDLLAEVERRVAALRRVEALKGPPPPGDPDATAGPPVADPAATAEFAPADPGATAGWVGAPAAGLPAPDAPPGYEVLGELGRGGMGVVYKARDVRLGRVVALKMLLAGGRATPGELARFRTEGEAVARLSHPNVVQVFGVGDHAGRPYLVLEYCPGGSLDARLAGAALPPREAAGLVAALARAVDAAHAAGIVHRDLKPQNVLLAADGTPKVADFGLAKWADGAAGAGLTGTGDVFGTPSYMAPEQARGHTRATDRRADVYALGAVLYACLTGRPPFKGATPLATLDQVRSHDPVAVRALQPAAPRDLETVCLKCLEKDPAKRYPTAQALADDLGRFLDGRPVIARPVGAAGRAWRWCRRNPAVAGLLAAVLLVSVAGTSVSGYYAVEAREQARQAGDREKEANGERDKVTAEQKKVTAERDRTAHLLYVSEMNHAGVAYADGRIGRLVEILRGTTPQPGEPDRRGWEWHFFDRLTRPAGRSFPVDVFRPDVTPRMPAYWALSPDGQRLVSSCVTEGNRAVPRGWDTATGARVALRLPPEATVLLEPDGASDTHDGLVWGPPPALSPDGEFAGAFFVDLSDRGKLYRLPQVGPGLDVRLRIWNVTTGAEVTGPTARGTEVLSLVLDGNDGPITIPGSLVIGPAAAWASWLERERVPPVLGFGLPFVIMSGNSDQLEPVPLVTTGVRRAVWDRATGQVRYTRFQPGTSMPSDPPGLGTSVATPAAAPPTTPQAVAPAPMVLTALSPSGIAVFRSDLHGSDSIHDRMVGGVNWLCHNLGVTGCRR